MIACCQSGPDTKVDSESIAPWWIVGCTVHVLSQSEKPKDDDNVRVPLRTGKSRAEFMQKSETVNPEHLRGEMGKAGSEQGHGNFPGSHGRGRRTVASEAHGEKTMAAKRSHIHHMCAQESKRIDGRADDRKQEEIHLKVPHPKIRRDARLLNVLGSLIATHVRTTRKSRPCSTVRGSAIHPLDCWDEERSGGSSDVFVSKESSSDSPSGTPGPVAVAC